MLQGRGTRFQCRALPRRSLALLALAQLHKVKAQASSDLRQDCTPTGCDTRGDCWIDSLREPCLCSAGVPELTGRIRQKLDVETREPGPVQYEYSCCSPSSGQHPSNTSCGFAAPKCAATYCISDDCRTDLDAKEPCSCSRGRPIVTATTAVRRHTYVQDIVYYTCCLDTNATAGPECEKFPAYPGAYIQIIMTVSLLLFFASGLLWNVDACMRRCRFNTGAADLLRNVAPVDGMELHRRVPPQRWCVTLQDLRDFSALVEQGIQDGTIRPTADDPFDPDDLWVGPSIHTINEQFIKPVTLDAGSPSWALMLHQDGLPCHVFFTHCWAEGIFEFLAKAIGSWPAGAKNAYVCFLSNPQNLDIGALVKNPRDSPFALALAASKVMIAVPNRSCSIYTRLWCTYEAYLAYSMNKRVFVATAASEDFWAQVFSHLSLVASVTAATVGVLAIVASYSASMFALIQGLILDKGVLQLALAPSSLVYFFLRQKHLHRRLCLLVKLMAILLGVASGNTCVLIVVNSWSLRCLHLHSMFWYFLATTASEVDRLHGIAALHEARQLRVGFSGRVRHAQCSVSTDAETILAEIEAKGVEDAVDDAIAVLLTSGMSTPTLRRAASRAGALRDIRQWSRLDLAIGIAGFLGTGVPRLLYGLTPVLFWWRLGLGLAWLGLLASLGPDKKAFAVSSCWLLAIPLSADMLDYHFPFAYDATFRYLTDAHAGDALAVFIVGPLVLLLSLAGPALTARVPMVGPLMIRLFIGMCPYKFWRPASHAIKDKDFTKRWSSDLYYRRSSSQFSSLYGAGFQRPSSTDSLASNERRTLQPRLSKESLQSVPEEKPVILEEARALWPDDTPPVPCDMLEECQAQLPGDLHLPPSKQPDERSDACPDDSHEHLEELPSVPPERTVDGWEPIGDVPAKTANAIAQEFVL
eukprot:TRINITY_DN91608_c0_g1_i1.p1 TRINITY_DN91608_c0_g1~~TRINITY_DN91608_c0_g1_i1.p1  ORF type:complete len:924 (+),score=67.70 TRINITY_DN91608_c0_g1_i1:96-2867(+)